MRLFLACGLSLLCGCGPGLDFTPSPKMSSEEMLKRASLVFVGVIQKHQFESWPFSRFSIPGEDPASTKYWRVLRREVHVEMVVRGAEPPKTINVYEIFWTGAASPYTNLTHDGERDLFLVRMENGRYHVVRDWRRSIFPVTGGPRQYLPLDDSHSLWERIALMNWWMPRNDAAQMTFRVFEDHDPGRALSPWRSVKLERGLVRHPSPGVRVPACRALLELGRGQDECWETLSGADRAHLHDGGSVCCSAAGIAAERLNEKLGAEWWWREFDDRESRRVLTGMNNAPLRREFCRRWEHEYPGDNDNGCPSDQPPPATIVTQQGDVPLIGPWPH